MAAIVLSGADGGIRTHDLPLTRRLLCQLSYVGGIIGGEWRRYFSELAKAYVNIGRGCELSTSNASRPAIMT
jgi:hypothetical protein